MKNLKKLSRNELKSLNGGKLYQGGAGDCGSVCTPGNGFCEQFGLVCGAYGLYQEGVLTSSCFKCM